MPFLIIVGVVGLLWMAHVAYAAWSGSLATALGRSMDDFRKQSLGKRLSLVIPYTTILTASVLWWLLGAGLGAFVALAFFAPTPHGAENQFGNPLFVGLVVYTIVVVLFGFWAVAYGEYHIQKTGPGGVVRRIGLVLLAAAVPPLLIRTDPASEWALRPLLIFAISGAVCFLVGSLMRWSRR
jgi:hypothetical protein